MECPRCGGRLTSYRLGERETVGCRQCAYVGVSVDHTATRGPPESWDDAIDRFEAQGQSVKRVTREDLPAEVPAAEPAETGEDLVVPVFDETDDEPTASREDTESADDTPSAESTDAGD